MANGAYDNLLTFHVANPIHSCLYLPPFYSLAIFCPFDLIMLHDDHQRQPRRQPSVDLCAILLAAFRTSHLLPRLSPAGLASFLLGASFSMMLGGSMTFLLGFLLFPWVVGLVMLLYLVGLVSSLSGLGRSIICRISPLESQRDVRSLLLPLQRNRII
ncbi:hypothetical protein ZIOFF_063355 [Zingiber officinale]|uniref:Uncharacterized protein n=1 Tax=Zingiber officinale TaxID=94328 RepID=A0A8J5KG44_ZINOF|nr:hypothetical protein ZIOFF_063355 [Zingiber officinale]